MTAPVPDPRFRDQLAGPVRATVSEDDETEALDIVYAWLGGDRAARTLLTRPGYDALTANIAQALADARAEVEARVRAAAKQGAEDFSVLSELVEAVGRGDHVLPGAYRRARQHLRDRAAALDAEAGPSVG